MENSAQTCAVIDEKTVKMLRQTAHPQGNLFAYLLQIFREDSEGQIDSLREALLSDQVKEAGELAHTLKGNAAVIGALRMKELANDICTRCREEDLPAVEAAEEVAAARNAFLDQVGSGK